MQHRVCAILLLLQKAELIDENGELKYSNLTLFGDDVFIFEDGFIEEYRSLFPVGKKSTPAEVKDKMNVLFTEMDVTEDQVINATKHYLSTVSNPTFCEKAGNFISKIVDGTRRSTLREFLETQETVAKPTYGTKLS